MFEPAPVAFVPPQFGIKLAAEAWESEAARALRRQVFCREQKLFSESDRDPIDAVAQTIVAVDYLMGMAHRIKYLDEALRRIERFGNVWHATPGQIAAYYAKTMMA